MHAHHVIRVSPEESYCSAPPYTTRTTDGLLLTVTWKLNSGLNSDSNEPHNDLVISDR